MASRALSRGGGLPPRTRDKRRDRDDPCAPGRLPHGLHARADPRTLLPASFEVESWRYEHTVAYGSPEYDRARADVLASEPSPDGLRVDLEVKDLRPGRVYEVRAPGVRSSDAVPLVHPAGVYTLNAAPGA